jgi:hypothetical protein
MTLTDEDFRAALRGYEEQKRQIDVLVARISQQLAGKTVSPAAAINAGNKRRISAAGRKRISEAQRRRWAAQKKAAA